MNNKFLITTALQETFPQNKDEEVIFLGEWCLTSETKNLCINNYKVLPYHWNDRKKLYKDYQVFIELYEKILIDLAHKLNELHRVKYNSRYWRILIGPWLADFIQIIFDRHTMLKRAFSENQSYKLNAIYRERLSFVPNDMKDFYQVFSTDDWNESIYVQLIQLCWSQQVEINWIKKAAKMPKQSAKFNHFKFYLKDKFIPFFNKLLTKKNDVFFIESYLPLKTQLKLQLRLGQKPTIWKSQSVPIINVEHEKRNWNFDKENVSNFEKTVRQMIPKNIPTIYLEGYSDLIEAIKKLHWPQHPKSIFTSNSFASDDIFKAWTADKTNEKFQLIIGQHGGHIGTNLFSFHEEHQLKIADIYLSWGWTNKKRHNINPIGNIKCFESHADYDPSGGALIVGLTLPRYSYHMMAIPVASQFLEYFEDQKTFLSCLPVNLQKKVTVRLSRTDYGWNQSERWKQSMPQIELDNGHEDIKLKIKKSRLYISTYNATTFLESMTWNIPTIIFWNEKYWELNDEAKFYFGILEKVGIFHKTPQSAAKKMIDIWDDVENWWNSRAIQEAKEIFINQYSKKPDDPLKVLENVLLHRN